MNKVLEAGVNLLKTIGKGWAFIGRSVTFSVSRGSYSAIESFVNVLINTTCLIGLIITFPGVVAFTAVGLPVDLVILAVGGVIEGCVFIGRVVDSAQNWHEAAVAAREAAKQARDANWEHLKPTMLSRVFIAQALQANHVPLDVAELFTRNIKADYDGAPVLDAKDVERLTTNNHALIFSVYHAKNRDVVIEMNDEIIEIGNPKILL